MNGPSWHEKNWNIPPWGSNPRDYIGASLKTHDGLTVKLERRNGRYVVSVGEAQPVEVYDGDDLSQCATVLNRLQVGEWK